MAETERDPVHFHFVDKIDEYYDKNQDKVKTFLITWNVQHYISSN